MTDGGTTWFHQASVPGKTFHSVYFTDNRTGWVVGTGGIILKTVDGGTHWLSQNSGTEQTLSSVYFIDATTGWVVGTGGVILKTIDGGTNWMSQSSGGLSWLSSVYFIDANTGWAVGLSGTLLTTTDGGTHWISRNSGTGFTLLSVYFIDASTGWVAGGHGTILKTTTGGGVTSVEDIHYSEAAIPNQITLMQNYPNPFNPNTTIRYDLPKASDVKLVIYNILGQKVRTLIDKNRSAGFHVVQWDGKNGAGVSVASGVYIYRIEAERFVKYRKMLLIR